MVNALNLNSFDQEFCNVKANELINKIKMMMQKSDFTTALVEVLDKYNFKSIPQEYEFFFSLEEQRKKRRSPVSVKFDVKKLDLMIQQIKILTTKHFSKHIMEDKSPETKAAVAFLQATGQLQKTGKNISPVPKKIAVAKGEDGKLPKNVFTAKAVKDGAVVKITKAASKNKEVIKLDIECDGNGKPKIEKIGKRKSKISCDTSKDY